LLSDLIQEATELNFPDKNPFNHNILVLYEEQLGTAEIFAKSKIIEEELFYEKYYQSYVNLIDRALQSYL
jgi:hypothetical protein